MMKEFLLYGFHNIFGFTIKSEIEDKNFVYKIFQRLMKNLNLKRDL